MSYPTDEAITPQRWLWQPRTKAIRLVEIHATRGAASPDAQYGATRNWMQSPNNNQGGWGGSCSYILGRDGRVCKVLDDNQMCTYSAGYGGAGSTYAIDEYGPSVEWCQSASQEEFTTAQYERGADLYAHYCRTLGVQPVMLDIQRQVGGPPSGFVRHDRCENGRKLGKSDPGIRFRDADFISRVRELLAPPRPEGEDMATTADNITELVRQAQGINARFVRADGQDEVYEIIDGRRVWLVSLAIALARGMAPNFSNVQVINAVQLLAWPEGTL